jgi:peroxiredoxin Q/BCP
VRAAGPVLPLPRTGCRRSRGQPDDEASHARFREKYSLPFTLLADPGHEVAEEYGVWVERNRAGRKSMGIERSTFVIDENGNVVRALRGVKPEGHAERVLEAFPG